MADLPDPPYPADTRAKGWRFELDYEQIEQSSTWALATAKAPEVRGWLLLMWLCSWKQVPCGSFPNDDAVIAAMIGMPLKTWAKLRDVLMRGWTAAADGRVYHETIGARVLEMLEWRRKNAKRVADFKAKRRSERGDSKDETQKQHTGNALPARKQHGSNDTGTGTTTYTEADASVAAKSPRASRKCPKNFQPGGEWSEANHPAVDWRAELDKFRDHTFKTAITDWDGAFRNWIRRAAENRRPGGAVIPINRQEAQEQRNRAVGDEWLRQQEASDATN